MVIATALVNHADSFVETDAGTIPSDWEVAKVDDVTLPLRSGRSKHSTSNIGYPLYGSTGPIGMCATPDQSGKSILVARVGANAGSIYVVDGVYGVTDNTIIVRPTKSISFDYLYYQLVQVDPKALLFGSGQPLITGTQLKALQIPLPNLREQEVIAAALLCADELIKSLEALVGKKHALKRSAMQAFFDNGMYLPDAINNRTTTDQYGSYPRPWSLTSLADLVEPDRPIRYGIVQPGVFDPDGRFMIRGQDYSAAKGWANPADVFRVSNAVEVRYKAARVKRRDLIITIVGYCGHVEMIPDWLDGANLTQTTARLAIRPDIASPHFCKHVIRSTYVQNQVSAYLKGNAQPGLNCGDVEKFLIPLPSLTEQVRIAAFLDDMDDDLKETELQLEKARQVKKGMMQELLTGRVRLV